jgi:thioredoxin reductase
MILQIRHATIVSIFHRTEFMAAKPQIAIIGAGPYGLSLAAHLRAWRIPFRIFGQPMDFWLTQMPAGMLLKSDGFASNLYDPESSSTLQRFCADHGIPYADLGIPVSLDTFTAYGLDFAQKHVPELERKLIVSLNRGKNGFALKAEDGEIISAKYAVVATGISAFAYTPPVLASLPDSLVSHSSLHRDLGGFKGKAVAVIGSGASASDLAMLLHEQGTQVHMVARQGFIRFNQKPPIKSFSTSPLVQLREPLGGIGPGWRNKIFGDAPWLVWYLPQSLRSKIFRRSHGPAAGWFAREKIEGGQVPVLLGYTVEAAKKGADNRVRLVLRGSNESKIELVVDHVIAATGYRIDLGKLTFLDAKLTAQLRHVENAPMLASNFESSVSNLFFIGAIAGPCFGPVLRFAFGAGFTSWRLARVLARRAA